MARRSGGRRRWGGGQGHAARGISGCSPFPLFLLSGGAERDGADGGADRRMRLGQFPVALLSLYPSFRGGPKATVQSSRGGPLRLIPSRWRSWVPGSPSAPRNDGAFHILLNVLAERLRHARL